MRKYDESIPKCRLCSALQLIDESCDIVEFLKLADEIQPLITFEYIQACW